MKRNSERLKKAVFISLILIISVLLGYLRDSVFKSINALLRAWDLDQNYSLPSFLSFLENYEYNTLVNMKWVLTFIVSFCYLLIALVTIKVLFHQKKYLKITTLTYAGVLVISGIFILIGLVFTHSSEKMYEFARYLMGMAQSPIILMILIPAFKLSEKENNKIQEM